MLRERRVQTCRGPDRSGPRASSRTSRVGWGTANRSISLSVHAPASLRIAGPSAFPRTSTLPALTVATVFVRVRLRELRPAEIRNFGPRPLPARCHSSGVKSLVSIAVILQEEAVAAERLARSLALVPPSAFPSAEQGLDCGGLRQGRAIRPPSNRQGERSSSYLDVNVVDLSQSIACPFEEIG